MCTAVPICEYQHENRRFSPSNIAISKNAYGKNAYRLTRSFYTSPG